MATVPVWKRLGQAKLGLADILSEEIAREEWLNPGLIRDIRGSKEFLLACDFGGSHQRSRYESFSFLAGSIAESGEWDELRRWVRTEYLSDGRRMSFKGLRDGQRARSLVPFLHAADKFPGVLVTLLLDKKIGSVIGDHEHPNFFPELVVAKRGWTKRAFHRLCVVASVGALLIAGLSAPSQDILWLTDQDEIAPNARQHDHAGWVFLLHINTYAPQNHGKLVFLTTEGDDEGRRLEDVVAIADLAAGGLAEALSLLRNEVGQLGCGLGIPLPEGLSDKAAVILAWLGGQGFLLRRLSIVLECMGPNGVSARIVRPQLVSGSVCPFNPSGSVGRVLVLS